LITCPSPGGEVDHYFRDAGPVFSWSGGCARPAGPRGWSAHTLRAGFITARYCRKVCGSFRNNIRRRATPRSWAVALKVWMWQSTDIPYARLQRL